MITPGAPHYSETLKLAMAEINAVLARYDIAAYVLLYEEHLSEYRLRIDPSWSVARFQDGGIRFRSTLEDFNGDEAAQQRANELTVGMLTHFTDLIARDLGLFLSLLEALAKRFEIEHDTGVHTPHRPH